MSVAECGELGEKKTVAFPGQFHEIAAVSEQLKSQAPVERDGRCDVPYNDLRHKLLCRIHVSAHSGLPLGQKLHRIVSRDLHEICARTPALTAGSSDLA